MLYLLFWLGESPSSSASDVDNLNNLAMADKVTLSKGSGSHAGNHVIVPRNRPNFVRLVDFVSWSTKIMLSASYFFCGSGLTWKCIFCLATTLNLVVFSSFIWGDGRRMPLQPFISWDEVSVHIELIYLSLLAIIEDCKVKLFFWTWHDINLFMLILAISFRRFLFFLLYVNLDYLVSLLTCI